MGTDFVMWIPLWVTIASLVLAAAMAFVVVRLAGGSFFALLMGFATSVLTSVLLYVTGFFTFPLFVVISVGFFVSGVLMSGWDDGEDTPAGPAEADRPRFRKFRIDR